MAPALWEAHRLIVGEDGFGEPVVRFVPEDRAIHAFYLLLSGPEMTRRAVKDWFARIGGGLTSTIGHEAECVWHPGDRRQPVVSPTERVEGVGPFTREACCEFRDVLAMTGRLLGEELVIG
jgi:hypothetical protein